jgi:hypothetical protein
MYITHNKEDTANLCGDRREMEKGYKGHGSKEHINTIL